MNLFDAIKALSNPKTQTKVTNKTGPVGDYIANRLVAPILQVPYNIKEAFGGEKKPIGVRALHGAAAIGGAIPGIDDIIVSGFDYAKGVAKSKQQGVKLPKALTSKTAVESLTGTNPVGGGDVLFPNDPQKALYGNLAEIPVTMLALGSINRKSINTADDLIASIAKKTKMGAGEADFFTVKQFDKLGMNPKLLKNLDDVQTPNYSITKLPKGNYSVSFNKNWTDLVKKAPDLPVRKQTKPEVKLPEGPRIVKTKPALKNALLKDPDTNVRLAPKTQTPDVMIPDTRKFRLPGLPEGPVKTTLALPSPQKNLVKTATDQLEKIAKSIKDGSIANSNLKPMQWIADYFSGGNPDVSSVLKREIITPLTSANQARANDIKRYKEAFTNILSENGIGPDLYRAVVDRLENTNKVTIVDPATAKRVDNATASIRSMLDDIFYRIKTSGGNEKVKYIENYFTHMFDTATSDKAKVQKLVDSTKYGYEPRYSTKFFTFGQKRKGAQGYSLNLPKVFNDYVDAATYQIHMNPYTKHLNEVVDVLKENGASPNFLNWLQTRQSLLTGKNLGRDELLKLIGPVNSRVIDDIFRNVSNNLAKSISTALTNTIPAFTVTLPTVGPRTFLSSAYKSIFQPLTEANDFSVDGLQSAFLRNRFSPEALGQDFLSKINNATGFANYIVDWWSTNVTVRSFFDKAKESGLDPESAMRQADDLAAKIIGTRETGAMPTVFYSKNPAARILTQFQYEPLNYLNYLKYQVPNASGGFNAKAIFTYAKLAAAAYLFNNVFEAVTGRRPALDPVDVTRDIITTATSDQDAADKVKSIANSVVQNVPMVSMWSGGRPAIMAGTSDLNRIVSNPLYEGSRSLLVYFNPAGGGYQVYKTWGGIQSAIKGYVADTRGNVMFPVVNNDPLKVAQAIILGKYSSAEARTYFDNNLSPLSDDDSIVFMRLMDTNPDKAFEYWQSVNNRRLLERPVNKLQQTQRDLRRSILSPESSDKDKKKAADKLINQAKKLPARLQEVQANKISLFGQQNTQPGFTSGLLTKVSGRSGVRIPSNKKASVKMPKLSASLPRFKEVSPPMFGGVAMATPSPLPKLKLSPIKQAQEYQAKLRLPQRYQA